MEYVRESSALASVGKWPYSQRPKGQQFLLKQGQGHRDKKIDEKVNVL